MRNLFLYLKIKRELKRFRKFKKNYKFEMKELKEKEDGSVFCGAVCLRENKDAEWVGVTDDIVNVGYIIHGAESKVLSNLLNLLKSQLYATFVT